MAIDETRLEAREREIYDKAAEMLQREVDAPTFSSCFFGPQGELAKLGAGREERRKIIESELYRWLKARYAELRLRDAASFERETRASSGRLTVVIPKSLHAALKSEAAREGVSLSELMRLKLAVPYQQMTELLASGRLRAHQPRPAR